MKLTDYIQKNHKGNVSAFAKSQGVAPNQVNRWVTRDCEWVKGKVLCPVTKAKKISEV